MRRQLRAARRAPVLGATFAGGAIGPFLLMFGLRQTDAASASLILNLEGVFTALSVYNQCAPATLNYRDADPEINLNVVSGGARSMEIRYAMSNNIGLGGHNGAVIFKRYDGD